MTDSITASTCIVAPNHVDAGGLSRWESYPLKVLLPIKKRGSVAKMSPPLRQKADVDALWRAVQEGAINVIGSDAAGPTVTSKEPLHDDIFSTPHG